MPITCSTGRYLCGTGRNRRCCPKPLPRARSGDSVLNDGVCSAAPDYQVDAGLGNTTSASCNALGLDETQKVDSFCRSCGANYETYLNKLKTDSSPGCYSLYVSESLTMTYDSKLKSFCGILRGTTIDLEYFIQGGTEVTTFAQAIGSLVFPAMNSSTEVIPDIVVPKIQVSGCVNASYCAIASARADIDYYSIGNQTLLAQFDTAAASLASTCGLSASDLSYRCAAVTKDAVSVQSVASSVVPAVLLMGLIKKMMQM